MLPMFLTTTAWYVLRCLLANTSFCGLMTRFLSSGSPSSCRTQRNTSGWSGSLHALTNLCQLCDVRCVQVAKVKQGKEMGATMKRANPTHYKQLCSAAPRGPVKDVSRCRHGSGVLKSTTLEPSSEPPAAV